MFLWMKLIGFFVDFFVDTLRFFVALQLHLAELFADL